MRVQQTSVLARKTRTSVGMGAPRAEPARNLRFSTKFALIETAERLFGLHGFDGISLREIAAEAGQRNVNAVQYHFGSKRGLINAILDFRFRQADKLRKELLAHRYAGRDMADLEVRDLLRLIWEPGFMEAPHESGITTFRFHLQYRLNAHMADHPFYYFNDQSVPIERLGQDQDRPCMYAVARCLRAKLPEIDDASFHKRTATIDYMFLCSVVEHDNRQRMQGLHSDFDFDLILNMMTAALSAPT